ncbi:hypothetical protein K438DRAFT_1790947 [Mycena galopus ATCC 62051]|nr:hypothetical protein K438DRAFT_1790947 [Mycena galopus ATCC 62051]
MLHRQLTADACQSLIRFREHRPRHGLKNKALIDYWLTSVQDHAYEDTVFFRGFLTLSDIRPDEVLGQIRCITMPVDPRGRVYHHSDSHLLFIQATTPPTSGLSPAVSDSPVAIFDYHYGSSAEDDAPLWRMTRTLEFRMDREDAAQLFAALALHPDNLLERGLSQRMVDWGSYAAHNNYIFCSSSTNQSGLEFQKPSCWLAKGPGTEGNGRKALPKLVYWLQSMPQAILKSSLKRLKELYGILTKAEGALLISRRTPNLPTQSRPSRDLIGRVENLLHHLNFSFILQAFLKPRQIALGMAC